MNKAGFAQIETYMLDCMRDSAHDREHVYRVLYFAMDIAGHEENVNKDVLIAACLLHDIGREEQYRNPELGHERVGSQKAYRFLTGIGWRRETAEHVSACIASHRYRGSNPPGSIEAKIVFDADKLDAAGTLGIARTLLYQGIVSEPLYTLNAQGEIADGALERQPSFFQEYKYKLERIYDRFYTQRGKQLAEEKKHAAAAFYDSMLKEVRACYANGKRALEDALE